MPQATSGAIAFRLGGASFAICQSGIPGSDDPNEETRAVRHIEEIEIEAGDVVELVGRSNRDEPLRIDYIDFTYVDDLLS